MVRYAWACLQSVTTYRVATGQGMVKEKTYKFREKSGNFILSQGKLN